MSGRSCSGRPRRRVLSARLLRNDSGGGGGGDNSCVMGPLPGLFGLRGAIGVAVGGGWVFRVFIGSWVDYRDVYYESSFWLGPCEVGTHLLPSNIAKIIASYLNEQYYLCAVSILILLFH